MDLGQNILSVHKATIGTDDFKIALRKLKAAVFKWPVIGGERVESIARFVA